MGTDHSPGALASSAPVYMSVVTEPGRGKMFHYFDAFHCNDNYSLGPS